MRRLEAAQQLGVDAIHADVLPQDFRDARVDRSGVRAADFRRGAHWQALDAVGKVAFVRPSHERRFKAESADDFGGARKQRNDARRHAC